MDLFLSARYGRRLELSDYRRQLERLGHRVTSRWLDGLHAEHDRAMPGPMAQGWAMDDYDDIVTSQLFLAFTETPDCGYSRGGRHVEAGIAYALGKDLWVIGPRENAFYCLPGIEVYPSFDALLTAFQELPTCL